MSHTPKFPESVKVLDLVNAGTPIGAAYKQVFGNRTGRPALSAVLADVSKMKTYKKTKAAPTSPAILLAMVHG